MRRVPSLLPRGRPPTRGWPCLPGWGPYAEAGRVSLQGPKKQGASGRTAPESLSWVLPAPGLTVSARTVHAHPLCTGLRRGLSRV